MVANINPIFAKGGVIAWSNVATAADTTTTGVTGANFFLDAAGSPWVAGADGVWLPGIRFKSKGANALSMARVFLNDGADNTVATNNLLYEEVILPATVLTQVAPQQVVYQPMGFIVPAGYRIFWTLATAVVGGWQGAFTAGEY